MTAASNRRWTAAQIAKIVAEHSKPIPKRPEKFDPLKASPQQLLHYGLPPNPSVANRAAYGLWLDLVQPVSIQLISTPLGFGPADYSLFSQAPFGAGREEESDNWSGIAVAADQPESFDVISCRIHVPSLTPPPTPQAAGVLPPAARAPSALAVSSWLGFDGLLGTSGSLAQIGITQSFLWVPNPANPITGDWQLTISAWWQWWMRDALTDVNTVPSLVVKEGDTVNCTLIRTSPFTAIGLMTDGNYSSGPIQLAPNLQNNPNPDPCLGRTAEWIVERPMKQKKYWPANPNADLWCKLYPLPEFDWVKFHDCLVTVDRAGAFTLRGPHPSRSLRTIEAKLQPSRGVVHSRALLDGPYKFRAGPQVGRSWPTTWPP